MLVLNIPKISEPPKLSGETQFCTSCEKEHPVEDFGWRYCYEERLTSCKKSRNKQAKIDNQIKKFNNFNAVTKMSWKKNDN